MGGVRCASGKSRGIGHELFVSAHGGGDRWRTRNRTGGIPIGIEKRERSRGAARAAITFLLRFSYADIREETWTTNQR